MKATVGGRLIAESDDILERGGYQYFPAQAVRHDYVEKAAKTADDLECPHGVQFYDVVVNGRRYDRAAWVYEAPRPPLQDIAGRFGFWHDVQIG